METKVEARERPVLKEEQGKEVTNEQLARPKEKKRERMIALDVEEDETYDLAI
ncbi:MAG: hypothetical protein Q8Q67_03590 [bacterium]|nr:hypothetical protein [bacterium]